MDRVRTRLMTDRAPRRSLLHRWLHRGRTIWALTGSGPRIPHRAPIDSLLRRASMPGKAGRAVRPLATKPAGKHRPVDEMVAFVTPGRRQPYGVGERLFARQANKGDAIRGSPDPGPIRTERAETKLGRAIITPKAETTRSQALAAPIITTIAAHRVGARVRDSTARPGAKLVERLTAPRRGKQTPPLKGAPAAVGRNRPHRRQRRRCRPSRR